MVGKAAPVDPPQSCLWYWFTDAAAAGLPIMVGESTPRGLLTSDAATLMGPGAALSPTRNKLSCPS